MRPEVVPVADVTVSTEPERLREQAPPADEQRPTAPGTETSMIAGISSAVGESVHSPEVLVSEQDRDALTIARGGGAVFVGRVAVRGLNYAYSAALVWGLGAESFGLFTLALAITTAVGLIADLGFGQGIVRFGAIQARTHGRVGIHRVTMSSLRVSLPVGLLLMLILLASADPIADGIFGKPQLAPLIRALGLSVPLVCLQSSLLAATRALKAMKYSVYVWVLQPLAGLVLAVLIMAYGLGMQAVALSFTVSNLLGAGLALVFYLRVIATTQESGEVISLRSMARFSLPLSLNTLVHFANERTELFFLGLLPSAVDVGIYNIAWRMAGMQTVFRESLEQIFAPFSSDLSHRRKIKQLEALYKATAKWSFVWALMLFLIFVLFADTIMGVFDPTFVAGGAVLVALGLAQLINAATGPCGTVLVMSGRSDLSLMNTIVLLGVSIGLDWLLIPKHGLAGAALAGSVAVTLVIFLRVIEVWLTLRIHPFKWSFAKPIIAGLLGTGLVHVLRTFVYQGPLLADLMYSLLFVAVYIAVIYLLKLDAEDMVVFDALRRRIAGSKTGLKGRSILKGRH
jgi:O-antigen/teichoic acid export membrane protein